MKDTEILKTLLTDEVITNQGHSKQIILDEPHVEGISCHISGCPPDTIVIKADAFQSPKGFFKGDNGECKRADYIIISEIKKVILYIELKAGDVDKTHIVKQLKGARCLLIYCQEIGKNFWRRADFLNDYNHRYICFYKLSMNKRPLKNDKLPLHDSPEEYLKITSRQQQFNKLARL